ncbi:unnamed protein product [Vitrella brassicaformis CCMP3155]|uniref:Uncharacterized protein n=1 Tax=Vitrella brassicaformis (strain CCMP3155) TaxID=1169540 RepID=A0A0G4EF29_VITBC|nr:unnamed protein product [Vitrella brassicaformis CCMP3155]|mmetsp:Transcript_44938/g.111615  ORF Transcript_44938/g.111615 Transcript_44938/m.111615 type:complete len:121 (-) Transcript_44938:364-726(-)|eukprot:CEL94124.1 unnamed protein product [Vitrella brassicaformis CCMP3155]
MTSIVSESDVEVGSWNRPIDEGDIWRVLTLWTALFVCSCYLIAGVRAVVAMRLFTKLIEGASVLLLFVSYGLVIGIVASMTISALIAGMHISIHLTIRYSTGILYSALQAGLILWFQSGM